MKRQSRNYSPAYGWSKAVGPLLEQQEASLSRMTRALGRDDLDEGAKVEKIMDAARRWMRLRSNMRMINAPADATSAHALVLRRFDVFADVGEVILAAIASGNDDRIEGAIDQYHAATDEAITLSQQITTEMESLTRRSLTGAS